MCVLFSQENSKGYAFNSLQPKEFPVFPIERSITIRKCSVRRRQVPTCPAFSLTDYKVQGLTLKTGVIDLKHELKAKGQSQHYKFCSNYVQLSRFQSLDGIHLLRTIDMNDLRFRPHDGLLAEMERLHKLNTETLAAWENQ